MTSVLVSLALDKIAEKLCGVIDDKTNFIKPFLKHLDDICQVASDETGGGDDIVNELIEALKDGPAAFPFGENRDRLLKSPVLQGDIEFLHELLSDHEVRVYVVFVCLVIPR